MAINKVAQIERLFQDITERFNRTNQYLSVAWGALEHTRESLQQLRIIYRITLEEQKPNKKEQESYDLK